MLRVIEAARVCAWVEARAETAEKLRRPREDSRGRYSNGSAANLTSLGPTDLFRPAADANLPGPGLPAGATEDVNQRDSDSADDHLLTSCLRTSSWLPVAAGLVGASGSCKRHGEIRARACRGHRGFSANVQLAAGELIAGGGFEVESERLDEAQRGGDQPCRR